MAHSPPLRTAGLINGLHSSRQSPSPPLQQPLSKRDKRRYNMEERLAQITHDFAENRDLYYRKHLSILHADMEYISQCNPYDDKPLEEFQGYNAEEAVASAAGSTNGSVRAGAGSFYTNGSMRLDPSYRPGKYALEYVKEINDALEQKDADLAAVAVSPITPTVISNALEPARHLLIDICNSIVTISQSTRYPKTMN